MLVKSYNIPVKLKYEFSVQLCNMVTTAHGYTQQALVQRYVLFWFGVFRQVLTL